MYADDCLVVLGVDVIDYEKLICFIDEIIKKHTDLNEFTKKIYHTSSDYSDGSIDALALIKSYVNENCINKELTQPEPKYKKAWYLAPNHRLLEWTYVHNKPGYIFCDESSPDSLGRRMFDSEQELIEEQIVYWVDLLKQLPQFKQLTGQSLAETSVQLPEAKNQPTVQDYEKWNPDSPLKFNNYDDLQKPTPLCAPSTEERPIPSDMFGHTALICNKCEQMYLGDSCPCALKEECQHESDGIIYTKTDGLKPTDFIQVQMKCLKCGEFYR